MANKPITREEKYLAYLTGTYTEEIPKPITRTEKYLYDLCQKGMSPDKIKEAVQEYLEENPVQIETDATLTKSGKAADSAVVGEKLSILNDIIRGTPRTATVAEFLDRQRTGIVNQAKERGKLTDQEYQKLITEEDE